MNTPDFLRLGAGIARKGWLEKKDAANTLALKSLIKELKHKRVKLETVSMLQAWLCKVWQHRFLTPKKSKKNI